MALTQDRVLPHKQSSIPEFAYSVQSGFRVFRGSMVGLCSDGTMAPAGVTATPAIVALIGLAEHLQDNTGTAALPSELVGAARVRARRGCFPLPFDAAPTAANIKAAVYAIDDQTVTLTAGSHLQIGTLAGFDENGVPWVQV